MIFMLYPMLSRTAFRIVCHKLDHGEQWHVDQYSIDCNAGVHTAFELLAVIAIIVYPIGVPVSFLYQLHNNRAVLSTDAPDKSDKSDMSEPSESESPTRNWNTSRSSVTHSGSSATTTRLATM